MVGRYARGNRPNERRTFCSVVRLSRTSRRIGANQQMREPIIHSRETPTSCEISNRSKATPVRGKKIARSVTFLRHVSRQSRVRRVVFHRVDEKRFNLDESDGPPLLQGLKQS